VSTSQGADDVSKQALEAAKRSEALLSQIAEQLKQQNDVLDKHGQVLKTQAEAQAQTSKQICNLKTDLSFKASSSRASKIKSEAIRKHAEPLEQVQDICASASAVLSGHISAEEPLSAE
jgi:predicted rRNA methylase YqxC with S4 and FtsJ domains